MYKKSILAFCLIMLLSFFLSLKVFASEDDGLITVNVTDEDVNYWSEGTTNWRKIEDDQAINGVEISSDKDIHSVEFTFEGSSIRWLGSVGPMRGKANVYLNKELVAENVDLYKENLEYQEVIFEKDVDLGTHTIKIIPTEEKNKDASFESITVDAFQYKPSLSLLIEEAKNLLYEAPQKPKEIGDRLIPYYSEDAQDYLIKKIARALFIKNKNEEEGEEYNKAIIDMIDAAEEFENMIYSPIIPDLTENEYNGEVVSATLAKGRVNNALKFNGEGDYIRLPSNFNIVDDSHSLTIETWIKPYDLPEEDNWNINEGILSFEGENTMYLTFGDGNDPRSLGLRGNLDESGWTTLVKSPLMEVEKWYHVAVTFNPDEGWILYIDGEKVDSNSNTEAFNEADGVSSLGGLTGGENRFFNGVMDEVRIWETTRTKEEIQENMDRELRGNEEGLKAYWSLDDYQVE